MTEPKKKENHSSEATIAEEKIICEKCGIEDKSVFDNSILFSTPICNSCRNSETIFPIF